MNSLIRLNAKRQLSRRTWKLFFISLTSFLLRYILLFSFSFCIFFYYKTTTFNLQADNPQHIFVFTVITLTFIAFFYLVTVFFFAVKQGEKTIYFYVSEGSKPYFRFLFRYLNPSVSFKTHALYTVVGFKKIGWVLFFSIPTAICVYSVFIIYKSAVFSPTLIYIICFGASVIIGFSVVMIRFSFMRYDYGFYLLSLNRTAKIRDNIKKSIQVTDPSLGDGVILEYSLLGWFFSCIFIFPVIYAVPYIKLSKSSFISGFADYREPLISNYAVNILKIN